MRSRPVDWQFATMTVAACGERRLRLTNALTFVECSPCQWKAFRAVLPTSCDRSQTGGTDNDANGSACLRQIHDSVGRATDRYGPPRRDRSVERSRPLQDADAARARGEDALLPQRHRRRAHHVSLTTSPSQVRQPGRLSLEDFAASLRSTPARRCATFRTRSVEQLRGDWSARDGERGGRPHAPSVR